MKWLIGTIIALIAAGGGATAWLRYAEEKHYWPYNTHLNGVSSDEQIASNAIGTWVGSFEKRNTTPQGTPITERAFIMVQFFADDVVDIKWVSTGSLDRGSWFCKDGVIKASGEKSDFTATISGNVLTGRFTTVGKEPFTLTRQ